MQTVEVVRPHVMRVIFDDGVTRDLEFLHGRNEGTVFARWTIPGTSLR